MQLRGSDAALYVHMVIVVSTPLVWWQFARLVLQMVTTAEDADEPPLEPQLRDRIEPPAPGRATPLGRAALVGSLCFCLLKWLLQLLGMRTLYWNPHPNPNHHPNPNPNPNQASHPSSDPP